MKTKLITILTEIINEVGDLTNIPPYGFTLKENGGYFIIEDDHRVTVELSKWPTGFYKNFKFPPVVETNSRPIYNIGYSVEGEGSQFMKSNYRTLIKILKTVSLIIEHHIKKLDSQNPVFTLFAESKVGRGHDDQQKMMLYQNIVSKNLPSNYRIGNGDYIPLNTKFIYISKIK